MSENYVKSPRDGADAPPPGRVAQQSRPADIRPVDGTAHEALRQAIANQD